MAAVHPDSETPPMELPARENSGAPIPVIINPGARSAKASRRLDDIRALSPRVELHATSGPGDASRLAESLARAGAPVIVAAGGDGTINEVVNGMAKAQEATGVQPRLGLLPAGTMNVFAVELGLAPSRLDACWEAITHGMPRRVDRWDVNGTSFVQLAGVGMDAAIIRETTWESKKRLGPLSYLVSGWKLLRRRATPLSVRAEGHPEVSGTVVLIGNGRNYGGPFPLFPEAVPGDGLLDVVVMPHHGLPEFYALAHALMSGHYEARRGVHYFQTSRLEVESGDGGSSPVPFEVDGELAGSAARLEFTRRGSLEVMVPRIPVLQSS